MSLNEDFKRKEESLLQHWLKRHLLIILKELQITHQIWCLIWKCIKMILILVDWVFNYRCFLTLLREETWTCLLHLKSWVTSVQTICNIMNEIESSKTMLSEVYRLIQIFLTIPVTTSTAERTFSSLKRLKTFLRSTMTQPRLNALMLMYVHRDLTESMDLIDIAKSFISVNDRRFHFGYF